MAIRPSDLRVYVIRPALQPHGLWSAEAEELLMLTAAQESQLGYYLHQSGGGPAMSPWQIEPATFDWLRGAFPQELGNRTSDELVYDLRLAALTARLRYRIDPAPLPSGLDVPGMAQLWKRVFNTAAGKGKWEDAVQAYQHYVKEGKQ